MEGFFYRIGPTAFDRHLQYLARINVIRMADMIDVHDFVNDIADVRSGSCSSRRNLPYRIPTMYLNGYIRFICMIYHPHLGACGDDDS